MSDMETWVDLFQWEEFYEVSNFGNVRSKHRILKKYPHSKPRYIGGVILKHFLNDRGYPCVNLTDGVRRKQYHVHLAVMRSFFGPAPDGLEVCHNDGNPSNTHISNFRYDTHKNNQADMRIHGTQQAGEKNPYAKMTAEIALKYRSGEISEQEAMTLTNMSLSGIRKVKYRCTWKHV